ncbi:MAG: hypothetical protein ACYSW8_21930, partial [Planctomycetota bacterium]
MITAYTSSVPASGIGTSNRNTVHHSGIIYMRCGNNTVAVLDSCRFILKIVNILHWNVITAKVAVEYGFESVHIPRIWVRLIQAGVSTLDRHAVNKLKRRVRVTTFYPLTPVGLVDA